MTGSNAMRRIQPQWWQKSVIGTVLGLTLSYLMVGLFAWFGPGGIDAPAKVQFNMWMITPLWLTTLSLSYLFVTWRTALLWLGGANVVAATAFVLLRAGA